MPVYEYRCRSCGEEFQRLVLGTPPETVRCPACGGGDTHRRWSTFGLGGGARGTSGCSGCAASGCSGCGR